jgi:hypothetical protein
MIALAIVTEASTDVVHVLTFSLNLDTQHNYFVGAQHTVLLLREFVGDL